MSDSVRSNDMSDDGPIVARPGRSYRIRRYLMALMLIGYGLWNVRDGFYEWPREKQIAEQMEAHGQTPPEKPHSDLDIFLNKALGVLCPPIGVGFVVWALWCSRGCYVLEQDVLYVAGHAPVPLARVRRLDKDLWDRKGIAYVEYEQPGRAQSGRLKLDDFLYEELPTEQIVVRIGQYLETHGPAPKVRAPIPRPADRPDA